MPTPTSQIESCGPCQVFLEVLLCAQLSGTKPDENSAPPAAVGLRLMHHLAVKQEAHWDPCAYKHIELHLLFNSTQDTLLAYKQCWPLGGIGPRLQNGPLVF